MSEPPRPDPDALLAEASKDLRGKLRIFLGMAPGVGKTWEMLSAAQRKQRSGVRVLAGIVETHGRKETMALLEGLKLLPRRLVPYEGRTLEELDLDALLAAKPALALVDELAHSNTPDSRHPKRWQDVEELLAAGIDVYTTLNVQHVESLNDVVAQITRVRVRETVPDAMLDEADEIELIDLTPNELIERLREGKVYGGDGGERALANYFTPGNLTALRELALRRTAERVDDQLRQHRLRQGVRDVWAAGESVLVAIDDSPASAQLVRAARRLADSLNAPWTVLHLETERSRRFNQTVQDRIAAALRLAEELGGEARTLPLRESLAEDLISYAREHNFTQIVVGKSQRPRWFEWLHGSVVDTLVRAAGGLTVVVIAQPAGGATEPLERAPFRFAPGPFRAYAELLFSIALVSVVFYGVDALIDIHNVSLAYIPVVLRAAVRYGQTPALVAAFVATLAYNFFFTDPVFTLQVNSLENVVALGFFGVIAVLTSRLTGRLREQTQMARDQADTTAGLLSFARRMAGLRKLDELLAATANELRSLLDVEAVLLTANETSGLVVKGSAPIGARLDEADLAAAHWCWEKGKAAGRGADTLPGARWLFVPVRTANATVAVAGVSRADADFVLGPSERRLLESICDLAAVGVERVRLAKNVDQAKLLVDQERLRASMLTAVSHDLRTPLASILGAVSSVRAYGEKMPASEREALLISAEEETQRLSRFVGNLLDLTRIDAGALTPALEPVSLAATITALLARMGPSLGARKLTLRIPGDLPALNLDPSLLEHIFTNLLENALKYTPEESAVEISAQRHRYNITLEVRDHGPGIPAEEQGKIFDLFHRVRQGDKSRAGTGLGLAIVRGFAQAMGVEVRVRNSPEGGAIFELEFPSRLIVRQPDDAVGTP